jgi:hypothetical protein
MIEKLTLFDVALDRVRLCALCVWLDVSHSSGYGRVAIAMLLSLS